MLPLVGQKLAIAHPGYESVLTSACILIAQAVTIPVAMIVGLKADEWGRKVLLTGACVALALRGAVFAMADTAPVLLAAQVLDGIAGGVWDVLVPLLIADFVVGSGRYSTSRGVLGTVQGIGGSLSNAAAGALAVWGGYSAAFAGLAVFALLACGLVMLLPAPEAVRDERERRLRKASVPDAVT